MKAKINSNLSLVFENRNFKAPELAKTILINHLEKELLISALDKDPLVSNRAMWVLNHCADLDFDRVKPFQAKLINHLKNKNVYSGVIRSILRIFQKHPIPKKQESFMLDKCFEFIRNPAEAIAIRVFAMTIVFNISKPYPELLNELSIVLNHLNITEESAAVRARIKNTLKENSKLKLK
jgi:hypothetical protein